MTVEEVSEVRRGRVVEGFVSEKQYFKMDAVKDREPVEILKDRDDMVTGAGVGKEEYSRVLDIVKFIVDFGWCAIKDAIVVVESGCDESIEKYFSSRKGE